MDYGMQFEFDPVRLTSLGFKQDEIVFLNNMLNMGYKINNATLQYMGLNYEQANRIKYMMAICCGKVTVDTKDELIKHLKKMNNGRCKIGLQNLAPSKIQTVPRIALVDGIQQEPFTIWNSRQYKGLDRFYIVTDVTGARITVETSRKPQIKYKGQMKIDEVLEIKGIKTNGKAVVAFNKKYCRLCNRFIIVATMRRPEFHHGMHEIICFEGSKVYVYARTMGVKDGIRYNGNTERVYAYGFFANEIKQKLDQVGKGIYNQLKGVSSEYTPGNQDFVLLDAVRQDTDLSDEIEE